MSALRATPLHHECSTFAGHFSHTDPDGAGCALGARGLHSKRRGAARLTERAPKFVKHIAEVITRATGTDMPRQASRILPLPAKRATVNSEQFVQRPSLDYEPSDIGALGCRCQSAPQRFHRR
jgi:hypothetical protein